MTQNIDRPRHRRSDAEERAGVAANGYGRPMATGYGTPPAGYGIPPQYGTGRHSTGQVGAGQYAPSFQTFGAPQHVTGGAPQHVTGQQPYGVPQQRQGVQQGFGTQLNIGTPQFAGYPQNLPTPQPVAAPPWPSNPEPPRRSNGLATAGLVVGIVAAVLSFIPFIGVVAWGLAPIALVLSAVGLVRSRRARQGRGASIAGLVLSVVALIMCVVYTVGFTSAVSTAQQQSTAVHNVTYKVTTAKGTRIAATYSQSRDNNLASASVTGAGSPWSANAQVSGFMGATVSASLSPDASHMNRSDTITCTIVEDGVQVAQNSASGPGATVTCTK